MYYVLSLLIFLSSPPLSPMGLDWEKEYKKTSIPEIEGYRYFFGEIGYGKIYYYGSKDFLDSEVELQISFKSRKISSALLILGPAGIGDYDCAEKYKKISEFLTKKYGKRSKVYVEKDPDIQDLVHDSPCLSFRIGLYLIESTWENENFIIKAVMLGDGDGIYIEINYDHRSRSKKKTKNEVEKLLKRL